MLVKGVHPSLLKPIPEIEKEKRERIDHELMNIFEENRLSYNELVNQREPVISNDCVNYLLR